MSRLVPFRFSFHVRSVILSFHVPLRFLAILTFRFILRFLGLFTVLAVVIYCLGLPVYPSTRFHVTNVEAKCHILSRKTVEMRFGKVNERRAREGGREPLSCAFFAYNPEPQAAGANIGQYAKNRKVLNDASAKTITSSPPHAPCISS